MAKTIIAAENKAYQLKTTDKTEVDETNKNIIMIPIPMADVEYPSRVSQFLPINVFLRSFEFFCIQPSRKHNSSKSWNMNTIGNIIISVCMFIMTQTVEKVG